MKYSVNKTDNHCTFKLDEQKLDSTLSADIKSEFLTLQAEGVKNLIFDLSEVKYTDSSGLSAILVGNRVFAEPDYFILAGVNDHVMKLIKISQLDKVLNILPTVEESIDAVFMHEIEKELGEESEEEEDQIL